MSALKHSPDRFITLPFRRGEKDVPNWLLCVNYVTTYHSSNFNSAVESAIRSMAEFHNTIVKVSESADTKNAPTENYINCVLKEHCRLLALAQAHLPLTSGGVFRVFEFFWRDSFDGVKYFSANSNLELVSCIYNLAASYCYIAVNQAQVGTTDSLRQAYNNFLNAAGYYVMTESLLGRLPSELVVRGDLKHDSLAMLKQICIAEAHHCGYLRFEDDATKTPEVRAKVAAETAKQYEDAHSQMRNSCWYTGKGTNAKEVEAHLNAMVQIMWARAHLHTACKYEADQDTGTAIAHYNAAKTYLSKLPKMPNSTLVAWVNSIVNGVNEAQKKAEEANRSIFYSRVPQSVPTPEGLPRPLGQPTEHASFVEFTSTRATDPFFGIVPSHITHAVCQWRDKQRRLVEVCLNAAANARATVQQKLQELNVTTAIASVASEVRTRGRVPERLRERVLQIQQAATAAMTDTNKVLMDQVNTCDQLYQVLQDKLKEAETELEHEKANEKTFLESYGEKIWRAVFPAAAKVPEYGVITAALAKHRSDLQQYLVAPFAAARTRCDGNLRDIGRLSWPIADLDALMPFVDTAEAKEISAKIMTLVQELKQVLADKEAIETEQQACIAQLRELLESDAVTFKLSAAGPVDHENIFASYSKQIADAIEEVNKRTRAESELVGRANRALEQLGLLQSADPADKEAAEVVRSIENACTTFTEVLEEFKKVARFGQSAINDVERTISVAKSFTESRKLQANEIAAQLDHQLAEKLSRMESAKAAVAHSQQRQEELRKQIAQLEAGHASYAHPAASNGNGYAQHMPHAAQTHAPSYPPVQPAKQQPPPLQAQAPPPLPDDIAPPSYDSLASMPPPPPLPPSMYDIPLSMTSSTATMHPPPPPPSFPPSALPPQQQQVQQVQTQQGYGQPMPPYNAYGPPLQTVQPPPMPQYAKVNPYPTYEPPPL